MKRKWLWLVCLFVLPVCAARGQNRQLQAARVRNPKVTYAPASKVRSFPFPVVNFMREGLARPSDVKEIMDVIVYPLVNHSPKPIAAVVVTFSPDNPNIGVFVLWHGTDFMDALVERDARGRFKPDAYKMFLEEMGEP
ncbi:MAG: hypothetical protein ABW250_03450 [Pyrinomonadaceae bacterium]